MVEECFAGYADRIACGLVGEGSERFGYDDELSVDHDYGAGFCLWLTDEDFANIGTELQNAYDRLPRDFLGWPAVGISKNGERRVGAMRTGDFYLKYTGLKSPPSTAEEWRRIPEAFLATATNGRVWSDSLREFSRWREILLGFYPEDVFRKKLAARAATMAQAGQYNYPRLLQRRDHVGAGLALAEFIKSACSAAYLINGRYMPFYKWVYRGMRDLPKLGAVYVLIGRAMETSDAREIIGKICLAFTEAFHERGLSSSRSDWMLEHAERIADGISDEGLRSLPIFVE